MSAPPTQPSTPTGASSPIGGIAAGVALVLLAVLIGVVGQHATTPAQRGSASDVTPTGHTTTVEVTASDMRFHPAQITVPRGDRLVITLRNADDKRHDLVLANGAKTPLIGRGDTARLDAGVIGGTVDGWCSVPGHRQAGMALTISVSGAASQARAGTEGATDGHGQASPAIDPKADPGPGFTARDANLPPVGADRLHRVTLHVREVVREVSPGVQQKLWTFDGTAPGPVLHGRIGDVFEVTLVNDGTMEHSIDFHAGALAPDQPMRSVAPGQSLVYRFTAGKAGIWMYHCATDPMLLHVGNGMYGAVVIDPPDLAPVAHEYVLVQSEWYLGAQGQPGDLAKMRADQPDAVVFNGYVAQYVHRPLTARPGERVRIWVLDAGPNRGSAFHVVGAQFDTVYKEGAFLLRPDSPGGSQELDLSPGGGGFVETVFPQAGHYPFLTHTLVDAERGARGVIEVTG